EYSDTDGAVRHRRAAANAEWCTGPTANDLVRRRPRIRSFAGWLDPGRSGLLGWSGDEMSVRLVSVRGARVACAALLLRHPARGSAPVAAARTRSPVPRRWPCCRTRTRPPLQSPPLEA